jgi:hypothetical protein
MKRGWSNCANSWRVSRLVQSFRGVFPNPPEVFVGRNVH